MQILFIIGGIAAILVIMVACMAIDRVYHWALRRRGVTELSSRQRRLLGKRYKETTGKNARKSKSKRARSVAK